MIMIIFMMVMVMVMMMMMMMMMMNHAHFFHHDQNVSLSHALIPNYDINPFYNKQSFFNIVKVYHMLYWEPFIKSACMHSI